MKFYYIFWLLIAASLAISFTNSIGVFETNYAAAPGNAQYELTDVNGTLQNTTPSDDVSLSVTGFFTALSFVKDLAVNAFYIYGAMIDIWHVPWQIAIVLQTILAISWAVFFIQLISRFSWGGMEG